MPHDLARSALPPPRQRHDGDGDVPRAAIIAAGALIATAIALAAAARLGLVQASPGPTDLRNLVTFSVVPTGPAADANGSRIQAAPLLIRDNATGASLAQLGPKQDPFLRTTLHALTAERAAAKRIADAPFTLARSGGGALVLRDPTTGAAIDLAAFGQSNEAQFAALLPGRADSHGVGKGGTSR